MQADLASVNLLHVTFATMTSHLYGANDARRTLLVDYYLSLRAMGVKGSRPLTELFPVLPRHTQIVLAKALLFTPFVRLGFFGAAPDALWTENMRKVLARMEERQSQVGVLPLTFARVLQMVCRKSVKSPETNLRMGDDILIEKAAAYIAANQSLTAFAVNGGAIRLGSVTKMMLDMARCTVPDCRVGKPAYHANLFKNAFLTAEVALPSDLVEDLRVSVLSFKNFIPLCTLYSLCYQTTLGVNLVPNVETMGFMLGFRGPESARYSYIREFGDRIGDKVSAKYDIRYDRILNVVFHGANTDHAFTIDPETKETSSIDLRNLPRRNSPFWKGRVRVGETGTEEVLGKSRGTYLIDHTAVHYGRLLSHEEHRYKFPYEVRLLTTRSRMTRSLSFSAFTCGKHEVRAFDRLVGVNEVTKPNLKKRPKAIDKRWLPIFDDYLSTNFSLSALAAVMKRDEVFFDRIKLKLRKLAKAINGKSLAEVDLCKISYEGLAFQGHVEQPYNVNDVEERYYMRLFRDCLDLWVQESSSTVLPSPVTVVIRKTKKGTKARIVCRQPILISLFESFANRVWQIIYQKINRGMDYAVSNYLPGLAVPLYSMERLADGIGGHDFALCNMDVKSCFDNVNLAHPNFLKVLDDGLAKVGEKVGPDAAVFLRRLFKDYLHENLVVGKKFKFRRSRTCLDAPIPTPGSLPTGFVLSPALWLTLALPAILETHARVREGVLFGFDLCGDDLVAAAPRSLTEDDKERVCAPWFDLANRLDLSFHFFKNYKDKRVHFDPKWNFLFEGRKDQSVASAWIDKFPAFSIPVFHAGTMLADKRHVETITAVDPDTLEGKLYAALGKRKRDKGANFLPHYVVLALSAHPNLENRLAAVSVAKCPGDRGDEGRGKRQFLTDAQSCIMPFFYTGKDTGGRGDGVASGRGWFLQTPGEGRH